MKKEILEKEIGKLYPQSLTKSLADGGMSCSFEVGDNIIRVPKNEYAKKGYEIEEQVLIYLQDIVKSVEIPYIKIVKNPFFYTIHKKIKGYYWNGEIYNKKTNTEKDSFAEACAIFFAELHSANVSEINTTLREIRPIKQNMETYLSKEFSVNEIDKIVSLTDKLFPLQDKVLIHNDFYHDNFFVDEKFRLKGVIDFANGGYFNYNFDFRKVTSHESGDADFWKRIVNYYERITGRKIDIEITKIINIHNYISFLVYFAKNPTIKEEKLLVRENWNHHINRIKENLKGL